VKTENKHWIENEVTSRQRIEQARALREQVGTSGLKFEAFLPTDIAQWVLGLVENGVFLDPAEAVFVFMGQAKDLEPHDDLIMEILKRSLDKAAKVPYYPHDEVEAKLEERAKDKGKPAVWKKIVHSQTAPDDTSL